MDAATNDQRTMLSDAVTRLFRDAEHAAAHAEKDGWQAALWSQVEALGLTLTLVPEALGGFGGSWEDAYVVLQAAGYYNIPLPLGEAILANKLLTAAGFEPAPGSVSLCTQVRGQLTAGAQGPTFTGELCGVPWGRDIEQIVAAAPLDGVPQIFVVSRTLTTSIKHSQNLAKEPRDDVHFVDAPVLAAPLLAAPATTAEGLAAVADYAALLRTAQMAGALCAVLDRSIEYAKARVQFGRPIGQFQAIQQQLALLGEEAAATDCAARCAFRAAMKADAGFEIGCAKLRANAAAGAATAIAHQVHAAIGFTHEYPLRHSTQRLWSWRGEFGNDRYWAARIGRAVAARGAAHYWSDLTAGDDATARAAEINA